MKLIAYLWLSSAIMWGIVAIALIIRGLQS
ncbi:Uncharacterised protein [uncultured archaeon]|nr:Uncharacterised protein [uncultured archaeon]